MDLVELSPIESRGEIEDKSGGQIQKIALADCLYSNKDIVVLDEPTSFLDIDSIKQA